MSEDPGGVGSQVEAAPRGGLTRRQREILDAALVILEAEGERALTMRRLAGGLGIKAPSLYKHFPSKEALEAGLIAIGFEQAARSFEEAIAAAASPLSPASPLSALGGAYRGFAHYHPHLYRLMHDRPLRRDELPPDVEARAAAPLLAAAGSLERARAAWAMAHGLVMLQLNGRFPPDADIDAAWAAGVAAFEDAPPG